MRDGWQTTCLGEICRLINGRAYKKPELLPSGKYLVLRVGNFFTNQNWYFSDLELDPSKYCDDGDLLYAWSASFGPKIWNGGKVIYHYHIWKTDFDKSKIDKDFLFYWFDWDKEKIKSEQGAGTTMIHVTKQSMENRFLHLPTLPEQKRIVAILDEAFAAIATAVANTEKNLANAREFFEGYLNFSFSVKSIKDKATDLSMVCQITSKLVDPREEKHIDLLHIGAGNIVSMSDKLIEVKSAREEGLISGKFLFDGDMVLYSKIRPYLKKVSRPQFKGLCSADIYPLNIDKEKIHRDYLYYLLLSKPFTDYAIAGSARAGMPKVNREHLFRYPFNLPDLENQKEISAKLDYLAVETNQLKLIYQQKLTALAELKQSLLQKAFTGELTAKKADSLLNEADEATA